MSERFVAAQADLEWRSNTGRVEADISALRREFHASTDAMSDDTLRLAIAQEKLDRAIARHGPASTQAKQAELSYRREVQSTTTAVRQQDVALDRHTRSLERFTRGGLAGTGMLRGLRGALVFASAGFLGGAGLVYGIRSAIDASTNLIEQQNKTRVVFKQSADDVLRWSETTASGFGISNDRALQAAGSFGAMLVPMGLARREAAAMSTDLVELAADLASFSNEDPSDMLERLRSGLSGEVEPLRRFGIVLSEARVKQHAYTVGIAETGDELTDQQKILARYSLILKDSADARGDFARTADSAANSERTVSALWRETQQLLGDALLPTYTELLHAVRDYLGSEANRAEIQRNVNTLVRDGVTVTRALAEVFGDVKGAIEPLVSAVGGLDRALEIAIGAALLVRLRRVAIGFAGIAASSSATTAKVVSDAAIAGRALDVAYRPRVVSVTTTGGFVGSRGSAPRGGRGGGGIPILGLTGPQAIAVAAGIAIYAGLRSGKKAAISGSEFEKLKAAARVDTRLSYEQVSEWADAGVLTPEQARELRGIIARRNARGGATRSPDSRGSRTSPGTVDENNRDRDRDRARRTTGDIELDIARARSTSGTADELGFLRELRDRQRAQIRSLERRKTLTDKQKEELRKLYGDLSATESEIESIIRNGEQEAEARRQAAAQARSEAQSRAAERAEATEEDLLTRRQRAEETPYLSDDRRRLVALRNFYARKAKDDELALDVRKEYAAKRDEIQRELDALPGKILRAKLETREEALVAARERSELDDSLANDIAAQRELVAFYRKQAQNDELTVKERREYARKRDRAKKELKDLREDQRDGDSSVTGQAARERAVDFLRQAHGLERDFASSIFTPGSEGGILRQPGVQSTKDLIAAPGNTVTIDKIELKFPEPTPDRHREALYMRHAVETAMQAS